jgi:thiosulfate dehydrogenase
MKIHQYCVNTGLFVMIVLAIAAIGSTPPPAGAVDDPAAAAAAAPIPAGPEGDLTRYGRQLITDTRKYAPDYITVGMDCSACHLNAGTVAHGGSLLGVYAKFPQWNASALRCQPRGHVPGRAGDVFLA